MSLNDLKLAFYVSELGDSNGSLDDLENRWLALQTGSTGATTDLWMEFLSEYEGSIGDRLYAYLGDLAYTGSLVDRLYTAYADQALVQGLSIQPVAYWNLDEASGNRADSIGSLTLQDNASVLSADGVGAGQTAAAFVAANSEYLSHADDAILRIGDRDWTMVGWLYSDSIAVGNKVFISKGGSAAGGEWDLRVATASVQMFVRNAANSAAAAVTLGTITEDSWNFIEFGFNATLGVLFGRLNNGSESTAALAGGTNASTNEFRMGRSSSTSYVDGRLQAFGIFHGLLTDDDRGYLYNGGTAARLAVGGVV